MLRVNRGVKIHRFRVRVQVNQAHVAVNKGRFPLIREKRVGYRVEWLRHYYMWEIMVALYKTTG